MSEATQDLIGKLLGTGSERDAIHIAVAPMTAAVALKPGQRVGTDGHGRISASEPHIGIVDPFLGAPVRAGERCFLFLYPNTATGLRHVYKHPALDSKDAEDKADSEQWLREFAERLFSYYGKYKDEGSRFDLLMSRAEAGSFGTDIEYADDCQPTAEFWDHYERYTGKKVAVRHEHFRCAC